MATAITSGDMAKLKLLTVREVSETTGLCPLTIHRATHPRGPLIPHRFGRAVRYSLAAVQEWIDQHCDGGEASNGD